jgi:hypothetical protein
MGTCPVPASPWTPGIRTVMKQFILACIAVIGFADLGRTDEYDTRRQQKRADDRAYEQSQQRKRDADTAYEYRQQRQRDDQRANDIRRQQERNDQRAYENRKQRERHDRTVIEARRQRAGSEKKRKDCEEGKRSGRDASDQAALSRGTLPSDHADTVPYDGCVDAENKIPFEKERHRATKE